MSRIEQVNELLQREIAQAIQRDVEAPGALITVIGVSCSPDFQEAQVRVSVLPDNRTGSTMERLRKQQGLVYSYIKKHTKLRRIPALRFVFDDTEKRAAAVREAIAEGNSEE
jgi:ribosome-binding factor A